MNYIRNSIKSQKINLRKFFSFTSWMSTQPFIPYAKYPKIFKKIDKNVANAYGQLKTYLLTFTENLETLASELQRLDTDFDLKIKEIEGQRKKENEANKSQPTQVGVLFSKQIGKLITQTKAFQFASGELKSNTISVIDQLIQDYHSNSVQIIQKFQNVLKEYDTVINEDEKIQANYKLAANNYIQAKSSKKEHQIRKTKNEYEKARLAAINSHSNKVDRAARTSLHLESILTEFENLEKYRINKTNEILNNFSEALFSAGAEFVTGKSELYASVKCINPDAESETLEKEVTIRSASVNDQYQPFRLPQEVTLILPESELFPEDIRKGRKFVKASKDYKGPPDHLEVIKDEVLLAEDRVVDGMVMCQNVNESIGLLPAEILIKMQ